MADGVEVIDFNKNSRSKQLQFLGVDVIITKDGQDIYIDEKISDKELKDIPLELEKIATVHNGFKSKDGWATDEKYITDVLVFHFSDKIAMIDYKKLRQALREEKSYFCSKYKTFTSDSGKVLYLPISAFSQDWTLKGYGIKHKVHKTMDYKDADDMTIDDLFDKYK